MMPGGGILPVWFSRAHRIEKVAEVRDSRVRAFVLEFFRLGPFKIFSGLNFAGNDFGVPVIGIFQGLGPALYDPVVVANDRLGMECDAVVAHDQRPFSAKNLKPALLAEFIIE